MKRIYIPISILVVIAIIFICRLFYLQVVEDKYKLLSDSNTRRENVLYPARGYIYDRNDSLIVSNKPAYNLMITYSQAAPFDTTEMCTLLDISKDNMKALLFKFNKDIQNKRFSKYQPYPLILQISNDNYPQIQEKLYKYPAFSIQKTTMRDYIHKTAANVLGFLGEVDNMDFIKKNQDYRLGDLMGVSGVEKTYESILRGIPGIEYQKVNVAGRITGKFADGQFDTQATTGQNINLTIDLELQQYGEQLMAGKRGSIVAIEPSTGEILALISSPTYDPSLLTGRARTANYSRLYQDPANILFDRALLAEYSPGSPFKLVTGMVALQMGAISVDGFTHVCGGGYRVGGHMMGCHCGTSYPLNLIIGIEKSCNSFFAATYKRSIESQGTSEEGMRIWSNHLRSLGLGVYLNTDLHTGRRGSIPNVEMYDKRYGKGRWGASTTISNAIGQGEVTITPMQMANIAAIIANHGQYYRPHILKEVAHEPISDTMFTKSVVTSIDSENFEPIVEGMARVFESGTGRWYKHPEIVMCGKTGTVENFRRINGKRVQLPDHSTFMAFAPKDNPRIAIAVIVENGYWGSRWAGPMAALMMEKYINRTILNKANEQRMMEGSLEDIYEKYDVTPNN